MGSIEISDELLNKSNVKHLNNSIEYNIENLDKIKKFVIYFSSLILDKNYSLPIIFDNLKIIDLSSLSNYDISEEDLKWLNKYFRKKIKISKITDVKYNSKIKYETNLKDLSDFYIDMTNIQDKSKFDSISEKSIVNNKINVAVKKSSKKLKSFEKFVVQQGFLTINNSSNLIDKIANIVFDIPSITSDIVYQLTQSKILSFATSYFLSSAGIGNWKYKYEVSAEEFKEKTSFNAPHIEQKELKENQTIKLLKDSSVATNKKEFLPEDKKLVKKEGKELKSIITIKQTQREESQYEKRNRAITELLKMNLRPDEFSNMFDVFFAFNNGKEKSPIATGNDKLKSPEFNFPKVLSSRIESIKIPGREFITFDQKALGSQITKQGTQLTGKHTSSFTIRADSKLFWLDIFNKFGEVSISDRFLSKSKESPTSLFSFNKMLDIYVKGSIFDENKFFTPTIKRNLEEVGFMYDNLIKRAENDLNHAKIFEEEVKGHWLENEVHIRVVKLEKMIKTMKDMKKSSLSKTYENSVSQIQQNQRFDLIDARYMWVFRNCRILGTSGKIPFKRESSDTASFTYDFTFRNIELWNYWN